MRPMTKDDIMPFCSNLSPNMFAPWSKGEYTYATNGHMIVRVPRLEDVPEREDAPSTDSVFPYKEPTNWIDFADIELPEKEMADCSKCNGDKTYHHEECPDCDGHDCEECDRTGKVAIRQPVPVGNTHYQIVYLSILKGLPNCKIGPNADPMNYAVFKFDGGDGLLMPMKPFGEWKEVKS